MKYGFVTVKVRNMEESLKFYTEVLKLEIAAQFSPQPGVTIAFLKDEDNNKVELIERGGIPGNGSDNGLVSIGFKVDNLDKVIEMVKERNLEIVAGPVSVPSGEQFIYIKDPNGVEIEFIEGFRL